MAVVGERYQLSNKFEAKNLMSELTEMKYDNVKGAKDFIIKIVHIHSKLKSYNIILHDKFVVHYALNFLPVEFNRIKTICNVLDETWSINDLIL